jgi:protein O-mannosyl-transferase
MPMVVETTAGVTHSSAGHDNDLPAGSLPAANGWSDATLVAILLFVTFLCYGNILTNGFVYDDDLQLLNNPYIRSWHFVPQIFGTTVWSFLGQAGSTNYYRPLMTLSYLVWWKIFGPMPFPFHLFSVVVHAGVVIMVFYTGLRVFADRRIAWCAALLFAIHPVHTETVDWVDALGELEMSFFFLCAFWLFAAPEKPTWKQQTALAILFALALLSKEPALMLVPIAILFQHFFRRPSRQNTAPAPPLPLSLPVWAVGGAYLLLRVGLFGNLAPVLQHPQISGTQSVYSALAMVSEYFRLLVWPTRLSLFHVFHVSTAISQPKVLAGISVMAIGVGAAAALWEKAPAVSFSMLWIGVTLLPVLNARWMAANVLTERYLYLPSVGFCWLAGWVVVGVRDAVPKFSPHWRVAIRNGWCIALGALCLLGMLATMMRNKVWRNDMTLYTHTLQTDPDAYPMHVNLAICYAESGDRQRAEAEYKRALQVQPDGFTALNDLGNLYLEEKRYTESLDLLQKAISVRPLGADGHFNYGRLLQKQGQEQQALEEFRKAVEVAPLNATAHRFYGEALSAAGRSAEAEAEYEKSLELGPTLAAEHGLIDLYLVSGHEEKARALLRRSVAENPYDGSVHLKLARLLEREGRRDEALKEYQKTLETDPNNEEAKSSQERLKRTHAGGSG